MILSNSVSFKRNLIFLIGIVYIFSRMIFLDRDVPPWDVSFYSAFDEFYYTVAGFNMFRFGNPDFDLTNYLQTENLYGHNFIQNLFTWISYELFGNNYYGLRMASVIGSIIALTFFVLILNRLFFQSERPKVFHKIIFWLIPIYILVDYNFIIAGRIAEPSIFRIASVLFMIWVYLKINKDKLFNIALLGFLSGCAVLLIYMNNLFVIISVFTLLILNKDISLKTTGKTASLFLIGLIISVIFYYTLYYIIFEKNPFLSMQATISNYEDRVNLFSFTSILSILKSFIGNSIKFISTNIFRHNLVLLIIFLSLLPVFIQKIRKYRSEIDLTIASFYIFLFLQSLFINDYFFRKQVLQLPLVLIIIGSSLFYLKEFISQIANTRYFKFYMLYLVLSWFVTIFIFIYSVRIYTFYNSPVVFINIITLSFFVLIFGFMFYKKSIRKSGIIAIFILLIVPNIFLNFRYIYWKPEYKHRDAMIDAAPLLNDKIIAGGPSHALRMYNSGIPVFDFWQFENNHKLYREKFFRLLADKKVDMSFAFINKAGEVYQSQFLDLKITDIGFTKIKELDINLDLLLPEKDVRLGIFKSP